MSLVQSPQGHSPTHRFLDLLGGDADPHTTSPLKVCHVQGLQGVAPHVLQGSCGESRDEERGPGAWQGPGPGPHGTAELQVGEDLPASDVADEEAEVLWVLEAGGRVVQKCPGSLVQCRAQRAPSLSP